MIPARLKKLLIDKLPQELASKVDQAKKDLNSAGFDDWGLDPETIKATLALLYRVYTDYFRVESVNIEHVPQGRVILVANHGGQIPLDGLLVGMSLLMDGKPPRIARGMVERFFPMLPFVSSLFMRLGQMVGDTHNCLDLLEHDECVLVFPEGVSGSGKSFRDRYQLQKFGTGFVRLALETRSPIVPVAVIGAEEAYPGITGLKPLARLFGLPYIPVTPFFPLLGPLGALPLPTKVTIRYGEPIYFEGDPDMPDADVEVRVAKVQAALDAELKTGLANRKDRIFTGSGA